MKCDKLTAYKGDVTIPVYGTIADAEVYLKKEVDAAIAELKQFAEDVCLERDDNQTAIDELQVHNINNTSLDVIANCEFYLKSEADKVIAHHKYKRCLAMAGRCRLRGRLFGACGLYEKELWALKWHKRWLELAEKFKEDV